MHAYVINLARSVDRRAHITSELKKTHLEYEIMTAVDGRDLDVHDPSIVDPSFRYWTQFVPGTAGAALSHLRAYEKILEDQLDEALVLEDDVTLPADLGNLADAVADHLTGAEVALLSYASWGSCKLSREGLAHLPAERLLALPIEIRLVNSGGAYIITREACERMLKCAPPIRMSPDDWWFFYREGTLDRVRCVMPLPVLKTPELTSTLGSYSLGTGRAARLVQPLLGHKIPILHQAVYFRRRRIYRHWSQVELADMPFIEKPSRLG